VTLSDRGVIQGDTIRQVCHRGWH